MIAIVSSNPAERAAFEALCESRGWPHVGCDSLRAFRGLLRHTRPKVVLVRHKLTDGYSDDVLALTRGASGAPLVKTIVLIAAGSASALEARQVALGADTVQRDPARVDVLVEYLARYHADGARPTGDRETLPPRAVRFAGAVIHPADRQLTFADQTITLTPRELALAELLAEHQGEVVSYHSLYAELLGRRFAGDTSNMRVLFGKLGRSLTRVGIDLRRWVEVIPKAGYRYRRDGLPFHP